MHKKTKGKIGYSTLKIDMSKAYDSVEWEFVLGVMKKMGFAERWRRWIYICMSTVSYKFLVSGNEVGPTTLVGGCIKETLSRPIFSSLCGMFVSLDS